MYTRTGNNSFRQFEERVPALRSAGRLAVEAAAFVRGLGPQDYPILEDDTTAVLLYHGNADSVGLLGDMTDWIDIAPFRRIQGSNLFFHRGTYEPEARLEYVLSVVPGEPMAADPLNPFSVWGFTRYAELAMPRYLRDPLFDPYLDGTKGSLEGMIVEEVPPGALPYPHEVHVLLPPAYREDAAYPAVYFQDGRDYLEFGAAAAVLRGLLVAGRIRPLIGVFVTPPNLHQPDLPNRTSEYGMNDAYVRFFCDELVPFIDARHRTRREPHARLVLGDSYGGLISAYIAFRRPDVFGNVCSQSGYHSFRNDRLLRLMAEAPVHPVRFFVDVGTYERRVGRGIVPEAECDFLAANRRLRDVLVSRGYDVAYREYHEGHTWGNWRAHMVDALMHFFPRGPRVKGFG